ncbi:histidine phosphatase family protein [Nocardia vinacea]|uniref:histidine phosphatase family protein n=1 Tax=Nocardia vinacea TaxID=96468 RepID=UPI0033D0990A
MSGSSADHGVRRAFLARHGRTARNADGRLRGLSNPPLDEVGLAEAHRLATVLTAEKPTAVVPSPLQRAVATGQAIASAAGIEVTVDGRLNDRDYGPWTGHPRSEVEERFGSVDSAPGVEPRAAVPHSSTSSPNTIRAQWFSCPA